MLCAIGVWVVILYCVERVVGELIKVFGGKGSLGKVKNVECRRCSRGIAGEGERGCDKLEVKPGIFLERVSKFCYLREMLGEEGGVELAVTNRVNKGWGKFNLLAPLLYNRGVWKGQGEIVCSLCEVLYVVWE